MKKDNKRYLFADCFLKQKLDEGYGLITQLKIKGIKKRICLKEGHCIDEFIKEQTGFMNWFKEKYIEKTNLIEKLKMFNTLEVEFIDKSEKE